MKLGLAFGDFSWPVPVSELGPTITSLARHADDAGFDSLWVMDHFFQIRLGGLPPESPMPEAYATLGVLAGQTGNIRLGTLVTSVAYRHPGVLLKTVTTLDVLSGGRMYLGVGAGAPWNVPPQGPGHRLRLGLPEPGRALDVGEQQSDRARRDRRGRSRAAHVRKDTPHPPRCGCLRPGRGSGRWSAPRYRP